MRVVIGAFGTLGDVGPVLRVAQAIESQGDSAVVLVNPFFEAYARKLGLKVRPVGPAWDPMELARDARFRDPSFVWRELFAPRIADDFAATMAVAREAPTAGVVNHFWFLGGALAAEARGLPWAMITLAPLAWLSTADPSQLMARRMPRWVLGGLTRWIVHPRVHRTYEPAVRDAARQLHLQERQDRFWGAQRRAALNLGLWSPRWRSRAVDDPIAARIVGFPTSPVLGSVSPAVEAFLESGEPPVMVGFGSALPSTCTALYRAVAEACVKLGRRALLIGATEEVAVGLEPRVLTTPAAPYAVLFPRASVIVHHGGIGSTAAGLRAGKPMLVLPFGNDQYDNAWRIEVLRVGLGLDGKQAEGSRLRDALRRCLLSEAMSAAAQSFADSLRVEEAGEVVAAREIRTVFACCPPRSSDLGRGGDLSEWRTQGVDRGRRSSRRSST